MRPFAVSICRLLCPLALLLAPALPAAARPERNVGQWEKLESAVLGDGYMDGDSMYVRHKGKTYIFRLYFVDTPETDDRSQDRNREQASYFGVSTDRVIPLGEQAKKFTRSLLSGRQLTVWTRWQDARGASQQQRFFACIEVDGQDLADALVANGLARVFGASAVTHDGQSPDNRFARLRQLESRAKARKLGAWGDKKGKKNKKNGALSGAFDDALEEDPGSGLDELLAETRGAPKKKKSRSTAMDAPADSLLDRLLREDDGPGAYDGKWPNVPTIAFLRAEAFVNGGQYEDAELEMRKLLNRFPAHRERPRIEFYYALSLAMQERFPEAIALFKTWQNRHPDDALAPDVAYWMPIAMYYNGDFADAIPLFDDYAREYPLSVYAPEAAYRAACCRYSLEDYDRCIPDLRDWLARNPDHYFRHEAAIMLGDSLAAVGELDEAKAAYRRAMLPEAGPFYYMALTQIARVHKALGEPADLRALAADYIQFIKDCPRDSNIVDAAYNAGWAYRQLRQPENAARLYWQIVELHGNTPAWEGFDLMLADLSKMYPGDPKAYPAELRARYERALSAQRLTLAARLNAAELDLLPPAETAARLPSFAGRYRPEILGPDTLSWLGHAWLAAGHRENGIGNLDLLLDRYPDSRHAPAAHAVLANAALDGKDYANALFHANHVLQNAAELDQLMDATFARAQALQGLGSYADAIRDYNTLLASRSAPRSVKPEALLGIGACMEAQQKYNEAIPYYQRIYVLYRAYPDAVAHAYIRSAACFEKIRDATAALNTYREFLESPFAAGTGAAATARQRLAALSAQTAQ